MFKLKSQTAFVKHVSPNKEKAGEDPNGELAATISFRLTSVPASVLKALAPVDPGSPTTIVDSMFDDKGMPRFRDGFGTIHFAAKVDDSVVTISGKAYRAARLKDFIVTRTTGGKKVDLEFKAQIHPTEEQVGQLCGKMKTEVTISVEGGSLSLDLEGEDEEGGEGEKDQGALTLVKGGKTTET